MDKFREILIEQASPPPSRSRGLCRGDHWAMLADAKGGRAHRIMGYIWVAPMATVALSSFLWHELRLVGAFSPIHLLSIFTLWSLYMAIRAAKDRRINAHRRGCRTFM